MDANFNYRDIFSSFEIFWKIKNKFLCIEHKLFFFFLMEIEMLIF